MNKPFQLHVVDEDEIACAEADPMLRKAMNRNAGAAILQDINLQTYWANTSGKTYYPGVYHLYKEELRSNMGRLMRTDISYKEMEEFLVVMGYEAGDIRNAFKDLTGMDAEKLEYMRLEDVKNTPANVPRYNLGWGPSKEKKEKGCTYFIMPFQSGLFTMFCQEDDMTRTEVATYMEYREAKQALRDSTSQAHFYDMPATELLSLKELDCDEPDSEQYMSLANHFYDQQRQGNFDAESAAKMVHDSYFSGNLTKVEGESLIKIYCEAEDEEKPVEEKSEERIPPDPKYHQDVPKVQREVQRATPDEFFRDVLPERSEIIAPDHVRSVMDYVSHRDKELSEFDMKLHSFQYIRHDMPKALIEPGPEDGRPVGPPRATVSVVMEIEDRGGDTKGAAGPQRKYALAVFFINPDGSVRTSDSIKGEDDIMYGFTEEGMRQYFSRDPGSKSS